MERRWFFEGVINQIIESHQAPHHIAGAFTILWQLSGHLVDTPTDIIQYHSISFNTISEGI